MLINFSLFIKILTFVFDQCLLKSEKLLTKILVYNIEKLISKLLFHFF